MPWCTDSLLLARINPKLIRQILFSTLPLSLSVHTVARDIYLRIAGRYVDDQDSRILNLGITLTKVINPSDLTDCYMSVADGQEERAKSPSKVGHRLVETSRGKKSKESFKVGCGLIEVIKSLASSGVTRWTKGKGWLGLGASDSRQERYDVCIAQMKSTE